MSPLVFFVCSLSSKLYRPTVEARIALYTAAHRQSEDIRVQIRKIHQASIKRGKYPKHSPELAAVRLSSAISNLILIILSQFQTLEKTSIAEVDKILVGLKKATGVAK
jgi:ribosome recycling factor